MQISSKQSKAGIEESLLKAKHYKMSCDIMMSTKWEGQSKQGIDSHSVSADTQYSTPFVRKKEHM